MSTTNSVHVVPASQIHFHDLSKFKFYSAGMSLYTMASIFATPFLLVKRRQQMGMSPSLIDLYKLEGPSGLFRGGSLSWISGANRMIYFTVYEEVGHCLGSLHHHRPSFMDALSDNTRVSVVAAVAAAAASILSQAVLTPLHVVTTRLHINKTQLSAWSVLRSVISKYGGVSVLWTGTLLPPPPPLH